jgi:hypothetical protein
MTAVQGIIVNKTTGGEHSMGIDTILWRRLDAVGHDARRLVQSDASWRLEGAAIFRHEGAPTCLAYWYEAPRFDYFALLHVSAVGFVEKYPDLWDAEP